MSIRVKKYSGELVPFDPNSLKSSLSKSGATQEQVSTVYQEIEQKIYDGISTNELYEIAFSLLKQHKSSYAARYSLKKALRDLGPEGYFFEKWVARIFEDDGYQACTSQIVQGHAVQHEVDVVILKDNVLTAIECKFRNDPETRISVTTPMYFLSRVKDLLSRPFKGFQGDSVFTDGILVTNAYFTSDSIQFAEYHKLNLLAWDYPKQRSLKDRVDNNGEYPITCLTTLSAQDKTTLLKHRNCILVKDIIDNPDILQGIQANNQQKKRILMEARELVDQPMNM